MNAESYHDTHGESQISMVVVALREKAVGRVPERGGGFFRWRNFEVTKVELKVCWKRWILPYKTTKRNPEISRLVGIPPWEAFGAMTIGFVDKRGSA